MKLYKLLFAILIIPSQLSAQNKSGAWPGKEIIQLPAMIKNRVVLSAEVLDNSGNDKIITEFLLSDSQSDTVLIDQMHNEGQAFLFQNLKNGFKIIALNENLDRQKTYDRNFEEYQFFVLNNKLKQIHRFIPSQQLINYLKRFKKYQKMR